MGSKQELPADAPIPRLCHLTKWPDFEGYGFNLQLGHFIGKVDEDSPAEWANLKENDQIIEVNGVPISNENHKQVVQRIKAVPNETHLLVIEKKNYDWYKDRNLIIRSTQSNVVHCKTPVPRPIKQMDEQQMNGKEEQVANRSISSNVSTKSSINESSPNTSLESNKIDNEQRVEENGKMNDEIVKESKQNIDEVTNKLKATKLQNESTIENNNNSEKAANQNLVSNSPVKKPMPTVVAKSHNFIVVNSEAEFAAEKLLKQEMKNNSSTPIKTDSNKDLNNYHHLSLSTSSSISKNSQSNNQPINQSINKLSNNIEINLNMSAQEMRKLIASKRNVKAECKKAPLDLKQKYEIIMQM